MRHLLSFSALLFSSALAQLSDNQAIQLAKEYARRIEPSLEVSRADVWEDAEFRSITVTINGRTLVSLNEDGTFSRYAGHGMPDVANRNWYESEEEIWRLAEAIIARFDPPAGLERRELRRLAGTPNRVSCRFGVHANGYLSEGGNSAHVSFRASDGLPLSVHVSRGWTYEPPNFRFSEEQARQLACARFGGDPSSWRVKIKYMGGTSPNLPERIRDLGSRKILRLCYFLSRVDEEGPVGMTVDTVNGDVLSAGRFGAIGTTKPISQDINRDVSADAPPSKRNPQAERVPSGAPAATVPVLTAILAAAGVWLVWKLRQRA